MNNFKQESSNTDAKSQMSTAEKKADVVQAPSDGATNTSEAGRGADNYKRQHSDSADRSGQVSCVLSKCRGLFK